MPEIIRSRNCVVFNKGNTLPVAISPAMVNLGWPGGQGVMWADATTDEFQVTFSDGRGAGFLIWGSDESSDQYISMTRQQTHYRNGVMLFGGSAMSTSSYEKYTYNSRMAPPLVPIVYHAQDKLYFSLRGLWTNEDEAALALLPYAPLESMGKCMQAPSALNNFFLGVLSTV